MKDGEENPVKLNEKAPPPPPPEPEKSESSGGDGKNPAEGQSSGDKAASETPGQGTNK